MRYLVIILLMSIYGINSFAQEGNLHGKVLEIIGKPIMYVPIKIKGLDRDILTDSTGTYFVSNLAYGSYEIQINEDGFEPYTQQIIIHANEQHKDIILINQQTSLDEVVVSGTMKAVSKLESPVPVEVYSAQYFKANPNPTIFDALQNINGVRPQLNCNVCNTGDIHINGLEGPYTMVLIDGMPIVSGLSTVYGLSGIPQSLIERVEVVKGPASTLYGSEAVGGLINIITKNTANAPKIAADLFSTSWHEVNLDVASKFNVTKKLASFLGINAFNYSHPIDNNQDGFTDLTLQKRFSVFNKWQWKRKFGRILDVAARYIYEDRWGGEMEWNPTYRGTDIYYGEHINTNRWELFGTYQLPTTEKILFQFSANQHEQNSVYGTLPFLAQQTIAFGQLTWHKKIKKHDLLTGLTFRYTFYDDNTPVTAASNNALLNKPIHTKLPGIFIQDAIKFNLQHTVLLGLRYDYNSIHGSVVTPRINYKWNSINKRNVIRISGGNGYRVANVFTEDHAALTGARKVEFIDHLKPETSWNANINLVKKIPTSRSHYTFDLSTFYTYFTNKIIAEYDTDPNKIIYDNLDGYAISKGLSLNVDMVINNALKVMLGATAMDVYSVSNKQKVRQLFTEKFTATWNIGYTFQNIGWSIDYTGNVYSPMRLPLLSEYDPRLRYSPWWSIQNIQVTKKIGKLFEVYGGVKNLLNWTPNRGNPFLIARAHDPFDKQVQFDSHGKAMVTPENPYGLTFDPTYMYGPNQGRRVFLGLRFTIL